jgi:hypothetical protein
MIFRWPLIVLMLAVVFTGCATHSRVASAPVTGPAPKSEAQNAVATTPTAAPKPADVLADATLNQFTKKQADLKAEPARILHGRPTILSWKLENATDVRINGVPVAKQGSMQIWPKKSSKYLLTARVQGEPVEDATEVFVSAIGGSPNAGGGDVSEFGPDGHSTRDDGLPEEATPATAGHGNRLGSSDAGGAGTSGKKSATSLGHGAGTSGSTKAAGGARSADAGRASSAGIATASAGRGRRKVSAAPGTSNRVPASAGEASASGVAQDSQPGAALDNLPPAKAMVSHPDPMHVEREETVKVAVSMDLEAKLGERDGGLLKDQHMVNTDLKVKASPYLGVEIKPSDDFKVRYLGSDNENRQSLGKDAAIWAFGVTPIHDGDDKKLTVVVTNYSRDKDGPSRVLLTQDEVIHVKVLPPLEIARRYIVEHWDWHWIWATIVLPIFAFIRRRFFPKGDNANGSGKDKDKDGTDSEGKESTAEAKRGAA